MSDNALLNLARSRRVICADGGFATHLEDALGVSNLGDSPVWSASVLSDSPHLIRQTHLDFLEAGTEIIGTATYQACHAGFLACGIEASKATELMRLAIDLADQARSSFLASNAQGDKAQVSKPLIALSLGPYGAYLRGGAEYTGDYLGVTQEDLVQFHYDRLRVFADAPDTWQKIDILAFETVPRLDEAEAILTALDRLAAERIEFKPAYASFVFPSGTSLPRGGEGVDVKKEGGLKSLVDLLGRKGGWGLSGLGINCTKAKFLPGLVSELTARLSERMASSEPFEAVLFLEPDGGLVYDGIARTWSSPDGGDSGDDSPASSVERWQRGLIQTLDQAQAAAGPGWSGVVLGGCCKATTSHISALRRAIDSLGI
ncbi:unnamed protein product [Tilletia controversa]|uniref:Hcy-binding domain-containing protein n=3 Tax=Tilletia TaxID=13289 RepID=A0A8X7MZ42_9BASI|nr:hypothetical protein CF336_g287 [Tilletia laevis]KAE8202345.1 hypothetical protein CF328_g2264 [Tilletia controversa]KAE8265533.1 hypothetical protein A4X03_0g206 [Tilletia caries]KAE8206785.1 hypothetical protein CF335_g1621 [Tilletia laevis]KAE8255337.1 hypothetical protein A4X06_0g484 [Tilletia controversa]